MPPRILCPTGWNISPPCADTTEEKHGLCRIPHQAQRLPLTSLSDPGHSPSQGLHQRPIVKVVSALSGESPFPGPSPSQACVVYVLGAGKKPDGSVGGIKPFPDGSCMVIAQVLDPTSGNILDLILPKEVEGSDNIHKIPDASSLPKVGVQLISHSPLNLRGSSRPVEHSLASDVGRQHKQDIPRRRLHGSLPPSS
eukprot:CAMPEP_0183306346 /NCGR_PEP_ID=MMETSP0160_2-20130417/10796_1 /TAXON_ID=2839 ORGANISM="Odontella Sinensis, Strain Grunow 1884" /NCGR_SAMPLE_ID=MMETSP0160_2 /ASSEMBLY_ACC=CAM_ASM_000250 /LENGTH=195 /DNA_ID=CAMNT_0025469699 /DNA_START=156 /DNA_END=741 /DNA_ORIENTATION=-